MTVDKEAIRRMDRAMNAIHLELPESVATDIHDTWNDAKAAMDEAAASLRKENGELKKRFEKSFKLAEIRRKEIDKLILEQDELQSSNEAKEKIIDKYAISARAIALWLKDFCNEDLTYDEMISDAARKVAKECEYWKKFIDELRDRLRQARNYIDDFPGEYYEGQKMIYEAVIDEITEEQLKNKTQ